MGPNTYVGARIGTPSQNGAIFEMANNKVLKVIVDIGYPPTDFRADFKAEVRVGKIPGIEKVGTIDAIAVGCAHETAISQVVILECCAVGGIRVFAHVILFDGHAPPGLVGCFAATES